MSTVSSANMSLPIPVVGSEPGPTYASDINSCMTIIDQHSHVAGSGVPITPAAININAALTFANNPATNLMYAHFYLQPSAPGANSGSLFVMNGTEGTPRPDLFYNDGVTNVQITSGGAVNATAASIPGESYAGGTFTWKQGAGSTTPANFDIGSVTIRPNTAATTNGVTLSPPAGIASAFTLALPSIPSGASFLQIDNLGVMSAGPLITGGLTTTNLSSSAGITGSQIAAATITTSNISASAGITGGQIATGTITATNIAASTITAAKIASSTITGGLLASSQDLPGHYTANSQNLVTTLAGAAAGKFLQIAHALILSNTIQSGSEGISSYNSGTGVVTFSTAFGATFPTVIVTPFGSAGTETAVVTGITSSTATIALAGATGFSIMVLGYN